jgi:hypothetical protein
MALPCFSQPFCYFAIALHLPSHQLTKLRSLIYNLYMMQIPASLHNRLRSLLLDCGPFVSDRALRRVFVDSRLAPWRNQLPTAESPDGRVAAAISFLLRRYSRQKENALVLFCRVLREQTPPEDLCHDRLDQVADELAEALRYDVVNIEREIERLLSEDDPRRQKMQRLIDELRHHNEMLREWKQLHQHLDTLSNLTYGQYAAQVRRYRDRPVDAAALKDAWRAVRLNIDRLLEWAKGIEHIGPPFRETAEEKHGVEWAVKLSEAADVIDEHLVQAPQTEQAVVTPSGWRRVLVPLREAQDPEPSEWWWSQLVDLSDELEHDMRVYMSMADENLRSAAADLYDLSRQVLWSER